MSRPLSLVADANPCAPLIPAAADAGQRHPVARRGHLATALLTAATWTTITSAGSKPARSEGAETEPSPITGWCAVPDKYNTLAAFDTSFSPSSSALHDEQDELASSSPEVSFVRVVAPSILDNDEEHKLASSSPNVSFVRAFPLGGDDEINKLLSSEPDVRLSNSARLTTPRRKSIVARRKSTVARRKSTSWTRTSKEGRSLAPRKNASGMYSRVT